MAKFAFDVAALFRTQVDDSTYNASLQTIVDTPPGSLALADGLVLGDPESGIGESGLSLTIGRSKRDKAFLSGSFTRSLSDFLKAEVPSFEFAFPFCGNRYSPGGAPTDVNAQHDPGIDALLEGAGLVGAAWGSGVGWRYVFGSAQPISALVYYSGNVIRLQSCRCSLAIEYTPGSVAVCTATIEVGSVLAPGTGSIPTLDYGVQGSVSAPVVKAVGHNWQDTRGFEELTLSIAPAFEEFPDSNATDGVIREASDRETKITGRLFSDDADKDYDLTQILATTAGALDQLSFQVSADMTTGNPALAHQIVAPQPELLTTAPQKLGTKAGTDIEAILRGATANSELEIIFR